VQLLKSTLVENTLQFAMFNFLFNNSSQMLNTENHINTFLERMSFEENEWRVMVTIKSARSQGKILHTQNHGQTNNGEVTINSKLKDFTENKEYTHRSRFRRNFSTRSFNKIKNRSKRYKRGQFSCR